MATLKQAVITLQKGGVIVYPTDTCYGLAADIWNESAVQKVYELKQMPEFKPMSILVKDLEMMREYGVLSSTAEKLAQKYLPGALTLIVPKTRKVPVFYASQTNLIGIRIPNHTISLQLVQQLGHPITTTSANLTGEPPAYTKKEIESYFENKDLLFLDEGDLKPKQPSTIVKVVGSKIELLRAGDLVLKEIH